MSEKPNRPVEESAVEPVRQTRVLSGVTVTITPTSETDKHVAHAHLDACRDSGSLSPHALSQAESLVLFVETPIIEDSFAGAHQDRREWQQTLPEDERAIVDASALKRNMLGAALSAVEAIPYLDPNAGDRLAAFEAERTALVKKLDEEYDTMDQAEKIAFVQDVKNFSLRVLKALEG